MIDLSIEEKAILAAFIEEMKWHPELEGVDVYGVPEDPGLGEKLLRFAAIKNRPKVCELLVKTGVNVNFVGHDGFTPLHEAAEQGSDEAFEVMVFLGADLNIKNDDGMTAVELRDMMRGE